MLSQELMLGDWVMLNPDLKEYYPFAGKPCMVIGLHDDDGAIKIEYDNEKYFWTDAEDDVFPIPLVPEILEKNGLRKVTLGGEHNTKYDYYIDTHFVGFYNMDALTRVHTSPIIYDIKQKLLFVDDKTMRKIELPCLYVHTLQHALKLCGIEKTIEL